MVASQISAQDLFRAAYENRYTWDSHFPGYRARVTYTHNGQVYTGEITVGPDLKPNVSGVAEESAQKAIHGQLFEVAIHRVRRAFSDVHGQNTFSYGESRPQGAVEILLGGKGQGDRYEVRDNEVTMVHRHIHGMVVTIHTFSSHDTGAGYLSHRYNSVYHDPQTGEQRGGLSSFEDDYEAVGGYQILRRRAISTEVEGNLDQQEFVFTDLALLPPA